LYDRSSTELEARAVDLYGNTIDVLKTFSTALMGTFYLNIITRRMKDSGLFDVDKHTYKYYKITPKDKDFKSLLESKIVGLAIKGDLES
jgi:hypothetical protein